MATLSTHDLRSNAKDYNRVKNHNSKWSRGSRGPAGTQINPFLTMAYTEPTHKRPERLDSRLRTAKRQVEVGKAIAQKNKMARKAFRGTVGEAVEDAHIQPNLEDLSDSSGDFEVNEASAAPELNEVMYSYDATRGPSHGGEILSYAITQAVCRFENNETDKIVKNEYDLVLDGKDEPESYVADADDDFEVIDDSHLK